MKGPQAGEWPILRALLPDDPVVYVDIGAGEPEECSNTIGFYQTGGYGLLIEPRPEVVRQLQLTRPRDIVVPLAAWDSSEKLVMRLCAGCSTVRSDWPIPRTEGLKEIPAEPTRDILDNAPTIRDTCQLCSIDVEGAEANVLRGIDWTTFRPSLFIIEYITWSDTNNSRDMSHEWESYLLDEGYQEIDRSWLNILYGTPELADHWRRIKHLVPPPHVKA
jgi:FkbM family methyltransferase